MTFKNITSDVLSISIGNRRNFLQFYIKYKQSFNYRLYCADLNTYHTLPVELSKMYRRNSTDVDIIRYLLNRGYINEEEYLELLIMVKQ